MNTRATLLPLTLLAISMTAQQATSATVSFEAPVSYVVGGGPRSIATADVNQDGVADVITADHEARVSVLLGAGDATLWPALSFAAGPGPIAVTVADLNSDGYLDLATVNDGDGSVTVLFGNDTGWFGAPEAHVAGQNPQWVAAGDLDQDGRMDLVVVNRSDVAVLLGLGGGSFAATDYVATPNQLSGGALAGDGSGGFWPVESFDLGASPKAMACVDLNGDLKMDLVTTQTAGAKAVVLLNDAAQPCTSFGVRRSGDPSTVRSAPVYALPLRSPFDDAPGTLSDGKLYFYVVESAAQTVLRLSVHPNNHLDAVRLGFNDGDPTSASPEPSLSSVQATPDTLPADGMTLALVVIVTPGVVA